MTTIDTTPPPAPTPAPARSRTPRIDPRLRQRWIDARREEGRRRLKLIGALLAALALLAAGFGALHSPLFEVRHVRVTFKDVPQGSGLTAAQIDAQAGLNRKRLMVGVATGQEARLIEQLPWVATARVQREWPGTIRIAVTARHPVAEVERVPGRPASGVALIDASGRVLALSPPGSASPGSRSVAGSDVPILPLLGALPAPGAPGTSILPSAGAGGRVGSAGQTGGAGGPVGTGGEVGPAGQVAEEELATAAALPPALQRRTSTITITANGLVLGLGSVTIVFGDAGELAQKMTSLETVLSKVSLAGVRTIDLRVPDRPALTGSQPTASLSTTAGG